MKEYKLHFMRPPSGDEIGAQGEIIQRACKDKSDAIRTGRNEATQRGWRFIGIYSVLN